MNSELLNEFIYDSKEHLSTAGAQLLNLERTPDSLDDLNALMGTLHTIKGNSGFLSLNNLYELLHQAENLLQTVREKQCTCPVSVVDLFLQVLDTVEALLTRLEKGGDDNLDWLDALKQALLEAEEQLELAFLGDSGLDLDPGLSSSGPPLIENQLSISPQNQGAGEATGAKCVAKKKNQENVPAEILITGDLTGQIHFIDLEDGQLFEDKDVLSAKISAMFEAGLQGLVLDFSLLTSISRVEVRVIYSIGQTNPEKISFVLNFQEQADLHRIFQLLHIDKTWAIFTEKDEAKLYLEGISHN